MSGSFYSSSGDDNMRQLRSRRPTGRSSHLHVGDAAIPGGARQQLVHRMDTTHTTTR